MALAQPMAQKLLTNLHIYLFNMEARVSAPILSRVKSWQFVGLGFSGWITLYSIAILSWGASGNIIGHAQGGSFAATMTLAGFEARRFKKGSAAPTPPADPLNWTVGIDTGQVNQAIARFVAKQDFRVEVPKPTETEMGFGVRTVKGGRTVVFETGRWKELVIDLPHAVSTDENRRKILADYAFIVGAGTPDEQSVAYVKAHPLQFLTGKELKNLLTKEIPPLPKEGTDEL